MPASSSSHADAKHQVLTLLTTRGCSPTLLNQLERSLDRERRRTVTSAAARAQVDRRTLERHWRRICRRRHLRDCLRLILLIRIAEAEGSIEERVRSIGTTVRAARDAARALTGRSLSDAIRDPVMLVALLESWLEPDVAIPS